jgi:hypothetical protein
MHRAIVVTLLLLAGCGTPSAPLKPVGTVRQIMEGTVHPSAEVVFESVGTIITASGTEEIAPKNDEEWTHVWANALTLAEAGNLLMIGDRPKDRDEWMKRAQALRDAGVLAMKAAEAKDREALFSAGGTVYEACEQCHYAYRTDGRWKGGMR